MKLRLIKQPKTSQNRRVPMPNQPVAPEACEERFFNILPSRAKPMKKVARKLVKSEPDAEPLVQDIDFNIHKFNNRLKPEDTREIVVISSFSEFGCETVGTMYCIPEVLRENAGKYSIVIGWHGREYLYRHLVDEFWELKEEHMWLREYCRAFHHKSKNLAMIEESMSRYGRPVTVGELGRYAICNRCWSCGHLWGSIDRFTGCVKCGSKDARTSVIGNIPEWREKAVKVPQPSQAKLDEVRPMLGPKPVGIFARGRKCYGRNLQPEFYVKLIALLRQMGYSPIWLGEKSTVQPCPVDDVIDFSRMSEARDLETTLAIISQLEFTVQFWTASTRLASMVGTPYLLFESPDQIWGRGQEGQRRNLCDFGPSKLVASHFLSVQERHDAGIEIVRKAIGEMECQNWDDMMGLLEDESVVLKMREENLERIGGNLELYGDNEAEHHSAQHGADEDHRQDASGG